MKNKVLKTGTMRDFHSKNVVNRISDPFGFMFFKMTFSDLRHFHKQIAMHQFTSSNPTYNAVQNHLNSTISDYFHCCFGTQHNEVVFATA